MTWIYIRYKFEPRRANKYPKYLPVKLLSGIFQKGNVKVVMKLNTCLLANILKDQVLLFINLKYPCLAVQKIIRFYKMCLTFSVYDEKLVALFEYD